MNFKDTRIGKFMFGDGSARDTTGSSPINPYQYGTEAGLFGGLNSGGIFNQASGLGGGSDKAEYFFYSPTRVINRQEYETTRAESWAARKFIDVPVDDMFILRREFEGLTKEESEAYREYEERYGVADKLARGMKAGRLYGTGLVIPITKEAPMDTPFRLERLQRGDLTNILVVDRFDCSVLGRERDPRSPRYAQPTQYLINLKRGGSFIVHASRVFRFDGQEALSDSGWSTYDEDWGVSELIPVIKSIYQEDALAAGCSHLAQEASIPVQKIKDFKEIIAAGADDNGTTLNTLSETVNFFKSMYRTTFMDAEDDFIRQEVTFTGLPELMDRYAKRLAAAANIPATRFWGQSPLGMNATGEGDAENYALQVAADQENKLRPIQNRMDRIIKKCMGFTKKFEYTYPSLMDSSDQEKVQVAVGKMNIAVNGVNAAILTEDEARDVLDGDPIIGELDKIFDTSSTPSFRNALALEGVNGAETEARAPAAETRAGVRPDNQAASAGASAAEIKSATSPS